MTPGWKSREFLAPKTPPFDVIVKAVVIGAGIGGLTTALQLHKIGWEVEVYESVGEIKPLGVGINLLPHGTLELVALGLAGELAEAGIETRALEFRTKYGRLILSDPRGKAAGFPVPQYAIHRGDLQKLLLDAVIERTGAGRIHTGCHFDHYREDNEKIVAWFVNRETGKPVAEATGDVLIGADGIHSALRRGFYPREGPPVFAGVMMWRGAREQAPFADGKTWFIAGYGDLKVVVYPISAQAQRHDRSLINWAAEIRIADAQPLNPDDWTREGDRKFIESFEEFTIDYLDVVELFANTEAIYEYPMIDRDPVPRWTFGRATLVGDAAHPMYPVGANGATQAILDAVCLAGVLAKHAPVEALRVYETERLPATREVVLSNRARGPEKVLDLVEQRSTGPKDKIEDLISPDELQDITLSYRKIAGFNVELVNKRAQELGL